METSIEATPTLSGTQQTNSEHWYQRAKAVIPLGSNTLSKRADQWPEGAPKFLHWGQGSIVTDVDGNRWLDWTASLGPMILGYCDIYTQLALSGQAYRCLLPLPHPLEVEVAEAIVEMCPGVEAVRLGKTGSDAVAAAVRCARAFTGRKLVLADVGYHGWHDWFATLLPYSGGVLDEQKDWTWRWDGRLSFWLHEAAALVIEPDRYTKTQLEEIQDYCAYHGTLVIWDEVICGFRMAPGGAREFYGIEPDLSCYGKAIANGMPLSAVGGSWEVMETFNHGFWSTTTAGETLSLAAAKSTLSQLRDGKILAEIGQRGTWLREQLERYGAKITGYPQHLRWEFSDDGERDYVQKVFLDHGILFNGHFFGNAAQTDEDVHFTIQAAMEALK